MNAENLIALTGLVVGFTLLTYFVRRTLDRIRTHSYTTGKSAGWAESEEHLVTLAIRRERERKSAQETIDNKNQYISSLQDQLSKTPRNALTKEDLQVLIDTAHTLGMAHRTWHSIKGTEPWQARARTQLEALNNIAQRILAEAQKTETPATPAMPGDAA